MEINEISIKNYFQEYLKFKQILSNKLEIAKENNYGEEVIKNLIDEEDLFLNFVLFSHIKNNFSYNSIEEKIVDNENYKLILHFAKDSIKDDEYNLLNCWQHYLIISFIDKLKILLIEKGKISLKNISFLALNQIISLFHQNNKIIYILYKKKKIKIQQIISLLEIYSFWIRDSYYLIQKEEKIIYDLFLKLKNYYLYQSYFELMKYIFLTEIKLNDENNNLNYLFDNLLKLNDYKQEDNLNNMIVLNNNSFHQFFSVIIDNMNKNIYIKYSKNLIIFCKNIVRNNFELSNIFEKMINNMKNSFLNLSAIKTEKDKDFEKDIVIQNFYSQLLNELFDENSENLQFFNFNGIDSTMSFKILKSKLSNTAIAFSFKFYSKDKINKEEQIYPLFTLHDESKNKNIFKLFIKYKIKDNKFYLYTTEEGQRLILIEDVSIEENKIYNITLYFENNKIYILLNDKIAKNIYNSKLEYDVVEIGYIKKHKNYFSGAIGPFFILKLIESDNPIKVIKHIEETYPNFIYSLSKDTKYNFNYTNTFEFYSRTEEKQKEDKIKEKLEYLKYKPNIHCQLYITPFILKCYAEIKEQYFDKYYLPSIPFICEEEKYYSILELNVSLTKSVKIGQTFLMNNGLYYICLQYEYFYQLISKLLNNNINIKLEEDFNEIVNSILKNTLSIISTYSDNILNFYKEFKMIFLNLLNCMKKFCLLNNKLFSDSFIKSFGNLICIIFDKIESSSNKNKNDKRKLVVFRDSLIDFLFSTEFYKNSEIKMIQYIFTLLNSIWRNVSDKIFLTNPKLIWKILSFVQLLENTISEKEEFLNDNDKDNKIIYKNEIKHQIFSMLKDYFLCIKSETYHIDMFCKLFHFCMQNYKDKYIILYYFLELIHDLIANEYYLEKNEIKTLMKYTTELIEKNKEFKENDNDNENIINIENEINLKENKEIINKNVYLILLILIDLNQFIMLEKELKNDFINLIMSLKSLNISIKILKSINNELYKVFTYFIRPNIFEEHEHEFNLYLKKVEQKFSLKVISGIYKIIFTFIKMINESNNMYKFNKGLQVTTVNNEILSLINKLIIKIKEKFKRKDKNDIYFIFQNALKFLYKIATSKLFNYFSVIESDYFILNLSEVIEICINEYILNTNNLLKIKVDGKYYQKTFIELIIDICMAILFNDKYMKSHRILINYLNSITYDPRITIKNQTIFYFNDLLYNQKKQDIKEKDILKVNNIFLKKNKKEFKMNFTTFALLKFASYYVYLNINLIKSNKDLNNYLERIINKLLQEHFELYKSYNYIFAKTSKNISYINLNKEILNYIIPKYKNRNYNVNSNIFQDFKDYFNNNFYDIISVCDEITSGNCNLDNFKNEQKKIVNKNSFSGTIPKEFRNKNDIKKDVVNFSMAITDTVKTNLLENINDNEQDEEIIPNEIKNEEINIINVEGEEENKDVINIIEEKEDDNKDIEKLIIKEYIDENQEIKLSDLNKNTYFLEDIDAYYISNIKKDIMNNIFSLFFIDTFYSNPLFQKMKLYYFNKYPKVNSNTKKMNFPSKIKKFNYGLEPDTLLKYNYKFFSDKYFPVSHPYFYQYMTKNNISSSKYIKLFPKNIDLSKIKKIIQLNCELIKNDKYYFGQLFYYFVDEKNEGILVFIEKKKDYKDYDESILDNEEKGKDIFTLSFINQKLKRGKTKSKDKSQIKRMNKIVIIHFSEIEEIIEKRCLLMWIAVEIYLKNGKSYFLNLLSSKNKDILLNLFEKVSSLKNLIHKKEFLESNKQINKGWKKGGVSTYENLLLLNKYASRSFNDSSQYPVFPWILSGNYDKIDKINLINNIEETNNDEDELLKSSLRIFKYPLCMQNQEKRNESIEKYIEDDEFKHHFGIHYSTSSFVYYYLMRQQPYSNLMIKLQNYQQENSNRMFLCLADSNLTLQGSKDSRELIPELFTNFEYFINLNCDYFGVKFDESIVDDHNILSKNTQFNLSNINPFTKYAYFILEHKKLLNSKIISKSINDWIDNIFGIGQYPSKAKEREIGCNIYMESTYEQHMNLKKKYIEYIEQAKTSDKKKKIFKSFLVDINLVVNFGQVPYQIFKKKYSKRKYPKKNNDILLNENEEEIKENNDLEQGLDSIHIINKIYKMKENNYYNYFEINPNLNKIFILSEERFMEVVNKNIFSRTQNKEGLNNNFSPLINKKLPYFSLLKKIQFKNIYPSFLYNIKYAFSSFDNEPEEINISHNSIFKTYGRTLLENLSQNKDKKENKDKEENNKNNIYLKFIICRYFDKSFKIYQLPMEKDKNIKNIPTPITYICEDYVNSCCSISFCQFLIGLRNGKLIQCSLDTKLNIKIDRYIQCHKGKINVIEINKKYGLIITSGDDNYILIRKLYDFELLSPIKIKEKFVITLAKVSPNNFLYVLCFNKIKNSFVIFGYSLNGLKFAKSEYGFYNNFDFTEDGNIVTFKKFDKLLILSGSNLEQIKIDKHAHEAEVINKIKNVIWLKYDYYLIRGKNDIYVYNRIITYINDKKSLITIDVSDNCFFN